MLDTEDVRNLILGKLKHRKCPCCDNNGRVYYDGESGMGISASPSGINPDNLAIESCENCSGLAFILYYE